MSTNDETIQHLIAARDAVSDQIQIALSRVTLELDSALRACSAMGNGISAVGNHVHGAFGTGTLLDEIIIRLDDKAAELQGMIREASEQSDEVLITSVQLNEQLAAAIERQRRLSE